MNKGSLTIDTDKNQATCYIKALPHVVLVCINLVFSGWHVIGSIALKDGANPLIFAFYREFSASILMFAMVLYKNSLQEYHGVELMPTIPRQDYFRFFWLGVSILANSVGTLYALQLISPTKYALMQPTIPIFATIISTLCGYEPLTVYKACGILFSVIGALIIELLDTSSTDDDASDHDTLGIIIVIVQCLGMANLIVFQKPLVKRYDPAYVTCIYYSIASLLTVLIVVGNYDTINKYDYIFQCDYMAWVALSYCAVFATALAYNAYSWVGRVTTPSVITVYSTLQPVGTMLLSLCIFNVFPNIFECLGGLLVCMGLVVTVYGRSIEVEAPSAYMALDSNGDPLNSGSSHKSSNASSILSNPDNLDEMSDPLLVHEFQPCGTRRVSSGSKFSMVDEDEEGFQEIIASE